MSEPVNPVEVAEGPPVPSAAAPEEEFDPAYEAFNAWERNTLRPGMNALAAGAYANTVLARTARVEAGGSADAAQAAREDAVAAAITALSAPGTLATSTTSMTIALGEPAFFIEPNKNLRAGMFVTISAPGGQVMYGRILLYDNATGEIEVLVTYTDGVGTFAQWSVAVSGPPTRTLRNKRFFFGGA